MTGGFRPAPPPGDAAARTANDRPGCCAHGVSLGCKKCVPCARKRAENDERAQAAYRFLVEAMRNANQAHDEVEEMALDCEERLVQAGGSDILARLDRVERDLGDIARILELRKLRRENSRLRDRIWDLENSR